MKKIKINLNENSYDVLIGRGIFGSLHKEVSKRKLSPEFFSVVDGNLNRLHKGKVDKLIDPKSKFIFKSGEKNKSFNTLQSIHRKMINKKLGRSGAVLALGGGIVGDVTGFAAATYMRGIHYLQVPTTLLAAVDSSVGGKTGINFDSTKNVIGSFYQPKLVLIDTDFFKTLPEEEILCGVGELVKYAFIIDKRFYNYLSKNLDKVLRLNPAAVEKVVVESVKYKGAVVAQDEREGGLRKVLNFGHTFAHAVEVEQKYKIKHGQAVIIGIACALQLSHKLGLIDNAALEEHLKFIKRFQKRIRIKSYDKRKLYSIMQRDKKNKNGTIRFVLMKDVGEMLLDVEAERKDVFEALDKGLRLFV